MRRRALLTGFGTALVSTVAGCLGGRQPPTAGGNSPPTDGADGSGGGGGGDTHPRFTETSLVGTGQCDNPGTASVHFDAEAVTVTGCARGPNGCAVLILADTAYTVDSDLLTVVVGSEVERRGDVGCTEALKPLGYEARIAMDGMVPGTVRVVHDDVDGRREVARVGLERA